jgi:hypothetical protein
MEYQLDLFEEIDDLKILEERDKALEKQLHNVRRGLFGRLGKVYQWMIRQEEVNDHHTAIMKEYGQKLALLESKLSEKDQEIRRLEKTISWMESVA